MNETPECAQMREKHWSECSVEEKIERCRQIIKQRDYRIECLEIEVRKLLTDFSVHAHCDGKVLSPVSGSQPWGYQGNPSTRRLRNEEEEYF